MYLRSEIVTRDGKNGKRKNRRRQKVNGLEMKRRKTYKKPF
ncbi:hypothetical protein HMPREF1326_00433 [Akkermansia sp. KLE1605]|nr:hypothetical protein HMPREF1326_00433 [Akkermansia sp. KLE1605]